MTKTLRDALLTIGEEEMLFRQSVHFSVCKDGLFYDDLKERIYAMYDTVRGMPSREGDIKDVILSYFAYSENMATFFADMFNIEALQEFRAIPEWDKINLDLMPESVPEGQTNFFDLTDEAYILLAASAFKIRPLPVKWTNDQFDRVLRASVSDKDADTGADAITSRFLYDSGFRIGYYSHSSLKLEGLTIPKREDYPREDVFLEYWAEFRGDLYSWISCYQEMKKVRQFLIDNVV